MTVVTFGKGRERNDEKNMRNLNFMCKVLFLLKKGERIRSYLKQIFKRYFLFGGRHMKDFLKCLLLYSRLLKLS